MSANFRALNFCDAFHKRGRKVLHASTHYITMYLGRRFNSAFDVAYEGNFVPRSMLSVEAAIVWRDSIRICNTSAVLFFIESPLPTKDAASISGRPIEVLDGVHPIATYRVIEGMGELHN